MVQQQSGFENGGGGRVLKKGDGVWPPQNSLRVRRPLLGGRRVIGGPSTPVPRWKLYENPFYDGIAAAAQQKSSQGGAGGRDVVVSARKLAATLWELQEFPFSTTASKKSSSCSCVKHTSASVAAKKARHHLLALVDRNAATNVSLSHHEADSHPECFHSHHAAIAKESMVSLHHSSQTWENEKKSSLSQSTNNRQVAAMRSHVHRLLERRADDRLSQLASAQGNPGSYMVLNRLRYLQEQQAGAAPSSLVADLRIELERARAKAHELELAHKAARREIDIVLKKVSEEKAVWRSKEQENIRSAVQALKMEAEEEKKARRRIELVSRKTSRELIDANIAVAKALQELERERKARELMEDVCDELAREIGEDKAEVEDLKRESAKVREEVEEERKMLQMAEVWREERVQMKLAEARLEIEDKNAILDHLRGELENFLMSRKAILEDVEGDEASLRAVVNEAEELKRAMDSLHLREALENSCRSPGTDAEPSCTSEVEQIDDGSRPDEGTTWNWAADPSSSVSRDFDPGLETRDQVLERLKRKYDQNGQHATPKGAEDGDSGRKWAYERDGSEWNSQSEHPSEHQSDHQGDDAKEEDGSQWESASDQDIVEAMERSNSCSPSQNSRGAADHEVGTPENDAQMHPRDYQSVSSNQRYIVKSPAEHSSGDESWKGATHLVGPPDQQRKITGEGYRSFLGGRGVPEVSRSNHTSSHSRLGSEQGIASPSRDWRSPDRGNPHIARGIKGFIEWPKMSRDNGNKLRSFESKVEKMERRLLKQST